MGIDVVMVSLHSSGAMTMTVDETKQTHAAGMLHNHGQASSEEERKNFLEPTKPHEYKIIQIKSYTVP